MYCAKCGSEMPDTAQFCPSCGQQVGAPLVDEKKGSRVGKTIGAAADKLYEATGGSGHADLKFKDFFSGVFQHHEKGEADKIFVCGTSETTPSIKDIAAEWPKPWIWSRVLAVFLVVFLACVMLYELFDNPIAIPSIIFIGSFMLPISILIFFFETNAPRNISLIETIAISFIGGITSILAIYFLNFGLLDQSGTGELLPSVLTGFIEEVAKIAIIVVVMKSRSRGQFLSLSKNYVLNGLLIGAAVGAGFAAFETAGYVFIYLYNGGYDLAMQVIFVRCILSIGGHAAWAAAEGAAIALCEKEDNFNNQQLYDPRFLIVALICIVLHGLWDMDVPVLDSIPYLKYVLLIITIWVIIAVMLNRGLDQINELATDEVESPDLDSEETASIDSINE